MPRGLAPQPRFHDTVTMPVPSAPEGMRVVLTADGPLPSLIDFFETQGGRSASYERKAASAVGLLYDYYIAVAARPDLEPKDFLSGFARALRRGTVDPKTGADPLDLYWPPVSLPRLREVLRYVTAYGDHCGTLAGTGPLNPLRPATFPEQVAAYRRLDARNARSLLKHLGNRAEMWRHAADTRTVAAPQAPKRTPRRPPFFPLERSTDLIFEGFRRRSSGAFWEQHNVRDMMIAVLQRFGGLRQSEPFHLFVGDVEPVVRDVTDSVLGTEARVTLYHPSEGAMRFRDPLTREVVVGTRAAYLLHVHGRRPRHIMKWSGEYAGWKDLMLDDGPQHSVNVHWFPREWGAVFWRLYDMYVRHVLPSGLTHPYLFVNLGGDEGTLGSPYRLESYDAQLRAAVRRIGLAPKKELGTTSHGLRHAYGQVLTKLKVERKYIQIFMHHKSPMSQDVYTQPEMRDAAEALERATERLRGEDEEGGVSARTLAAGSLLSSSTLGLLR